MHTSFLSRYIIICCLITCSHLKFCNVAYIQLNWPREQMYYVSFSVEDFFSTSFSIQGHNYLWLIFAGMEFSNTLGQEEINNNCLKVKEKQNYLEIVISDWYLPTALSIWRSNAKVNFKKSIPFVEKLFTVFNKCNILMPLMQLQNYQYFHIELHQT